VQFGQPLDLVKISVSWALSSRDGSLAGAACGASPSSAQERELDVVADDRVG
jgi:hypothetical protein